MGFSPKSLFIDIALNFFRTPFFLPKLIPELTWRIETPAKELYLTFDDGPVPGPTEFVLDVLQNANVVATFFCIGDNIRKYPALLSKVIKANHVVANHTFNHLSGWKTGTKSYIDNIKLCEAQIISNDPLPAKESRSTRPPFLFRPPYGRITPSQIKSLRDYEIVMWDVLTNDYARSLSPERCLKGSIAATRPGSIIVFHDSLKAEKNMTFVLPRYVEHFVNLGYTFKALR